MALDNPSQEKDIICTDVGGTLLGRGDVIINQHIHQALRDYHASGKEIWILTDGSKWDGNDYRETFKNDHPDHIDIFSKVISKDTFKLNKREPDYWWNLRQSTGKNLQKLVFIDDVSEILQRAQKNNVHTVDANLGPDEFFKALNNAVNEAHGTVKPDNQATEEKETTVILLTDIGGTLIDYSKNIHRPELYQTYLALKDNGHDIFMVTDYEDLRARDVKNTLRQNHPDGIDIFAGYFSRGTFGYAKDKKAYWQSLINQFKNNEQYADKNLTFVLVDDDTDNLDAADLFGVHGINAGYDIEDKDIAAAVRNYFPSLLKL